MGCSTIVPGGIHTNAPSWNKPVFSAVNACRSGGANLPRYGSTAAGFVARTDRRLDTCTPAGSSPPENCGA